MTSARIFYSEKNSLRTLHANQLFGLQISRIQRGKPVLNKCHIVHQVKNNFLSQGGETALLQDSTTNTSETTVRKGVLWQQRDKVFSRSKSLTFVWSRVLLKDRPFYNTLLKLSSFLEQPA